LDYNLSIVRYPPRELSSSPFRWQAIRVGQEAYSLMASSGFPGKVLAVFSNCIYLSGRAGEIFWVGQEHLPMHRRCITAPFQPHSLRLGQAFFTEGSLLKIGGVVVIDLDRAEKWKPFIIGPDETDSMTMVNDRLNHLFSILSMPNPDTGLGPAVPVISAIVEGRDPEKTPPDPFFTHAIPPILAITKACLCEDIVRVTQMARELIGLGPGLTPSGDDFLGGLFFVFHFLKRIFPEDFFWDEQPILDLIDWSSSRTHPISHAILSDLSSGHGPEPLHDILNFLLSGGDRNKMLLNIDRLCGIGNTSGSDIIAGLLTGMLVVRGKA
jgi:hypothetical protein